MTRTDTHTNRTRKTITIVIAALLMFPAVGASVAAAESTTPVTLSPADTTIEPGNTQTFDVVVQNPNNGIGSYQGKIALADPSIATITDVKVRGNTAFSGETVSDDGSSASFDAILKEPLTAGQDGTITIATVTVKGEQAGATDVSLDIDDIGDKNANSYTEDPVKGATLTVGQADTTAPTISNFDVSASGQNVDVSFQSDEQLADIGVSLGDDASGTLSEGDFDESESGGTYTYTADVSNGEDGTFSATLDTAADAAGNDGANGQSDSVTVDTAPDNQPPTADAGEDQTVDENTQVTLDASGSNDPDGDSLNYAWTQTGDGPSVDLSDADTATPMFTAPDVDKKKTLTFGVEVTDGNGGTDKDSVSVTVTPVDDTAPTITNFGLTNPEGQTLEVSFDSDEDLADISVEIADDSGTTVTTLGTGEFSSSGGTYTATYEADGPGTYTATLVTAADAADNDGANGQSDTATIGESNSAPTAAFSSSPESPTVGDEVSFDAGGSSDTDGSIASYEWTFGDGATGSGETTTHTYDSAGEYTVALTVTDDDGATDTTTQTVTVAEKGTPELAVSPGSLDFGSVTVGQSETKTVTVTNDGGAPVTVSGYGINVDQGSPGEFTVANDDGDRSFTLAPGENKNLDVTFAPSSAGDKSANLYVNTENDGSAETSLSATGSEEAEPGMIDAPGSQAFGAVTVDQSATKGVTVTNDGGSPVTVSGYGINVGQGSSAEFSVANDADGDRRFTLGAGESRNLDVTFAPNSEGPKSANLYVNTENDGSTNTALTGSGKAKMNTLRIEGGGDYAFYSFRVSEDIEANNANKEDRVRGITASGAVGATGEDTYRFKGDLRNLYVTDDAKVFVNGEQVNPDNYESVLTMRGQGSYSSYNFELRNGQIQSTSGLSQEDSTSGDEASGAVGGTGYDRYKFSGTFEGFDEDGDALVVLNGQSVDPSLFYNTVTLSGDGSYSFTTSGEVKSGSGLSQEDSINGDSASGAVGGGSDSYVYSGSIQNLNTDPGVTADGDEDDFNG